MIESSDWCRILWLKKLELSSGSHKVQKSLLNMHEEKFWKDTVESISEQFEQRLDAKEQDIFEMKESLRLMRVDRAQLQNDLADQELPRFRRWETIWALLREN